MRKAKACLQCRAAKRKCQGKEDGSCNECHERGIECSKSSNIRPSSSRTLAPAAGAAFSSLVRSPSDFDSPSSFLPKQGSETFHRPSLDVILDLAGLYLQYIHDRPHSLFHKATLWSDLEGNRVPPALLYAICGMGARFSSDKSIAAMAPVFRAESTASIHHNIEEISLANIQACVLIANLCAADLQTRAEALYFGIANRMATILGLHKTDFGDSIIVREVKTRVWWTLVMADKWCSSGLDIPQQLSHSGRPIRLPYDEYEFQSWRRDARSPARQPEPGLWAHMITLVEIFEPIQTLNRGLVEEHMTMHNLDAETHRLAGLLDNWLCKLPADVHWSAENIELHKSKGLGGPLVALHLGFHHYSTLLFFQYLDLTRMATAESLVFASRCRYHATAYSDILKTSREQVGCEAVYATVGHMTVVSSSVLLYTLLFGADDLVLDARQRLNTNFAALVELKELWPSLSSTMNRLFTFQNACLHSADPNTHKIDRWMVRFLLEHAIPLDDRFSVPVSEFGSDRERLSGYSEELSRRQELAEEALAQLLE